MTSKKHLWKLPVLVASLAMGLGVFTVIKASPKNAEPAFATYTNGDAATYYNSIDSTQSGNTLLTALRSLNLSKRQSTVGYSSMGTSPSGQFKYTDYDPNYVQYDSNGKPYGTKISSFYTYTSATSWNREHVWPNSHGGGSGGDAGSPYPDADIHMPRPTISSENSSRGNSFFVEGMSSSSGGWDPYTAGYNENSRGEAARITFYCTLVNSKLILAPNNTTPSGKDSVTGQSFGDGHTMGNLETLIKWNINYPVTQREKNRNEGAEYLQGNRNAFIDHPEYACKIWGTVNSKIKSMCENASWDVGPSVSISKSSASIAVDGETTISATASDSSTISWTSSDTTIVTVSSASSTSGTNITLTGVGPGTATVTARATINSTTYSATCTVTVSSSGSGGDDPVSTDGVTINVSDIPSAYATTSFTASGYSFGCSNIGNSYSSGNMQWKSGQGYMYNTTPITGISSITIAAPTTGSFSGTIYVGSSSHPTSGTSYSITSGSTVSISGSPSYFTIKAGTVSGGAKCGGITIGQTATKTLSSISVATAPTKTTYTAGEYFDPTGLVITRTYSDSTSDTYTYANHTSDFTFSPSTSTALTTSNSSVTITYGGKSCSQAITVNAAKTLSSISISTAPTKTTYTAGEYFNPTGLVIRRTYSDSTYDTYTYSGHTSEFTFSPSTSTTLTTSNASVTITYSGKSTSQAITVNAATKTLSSISVSGGKTSFTVDEEFSFGGTVTAHFSDSSTSDVTSSATFTGYNMSVAGNYTVTVSYTYGGTTKTATYSITVQGSGGGSSTEEGSQRIVASGTTTYYQSGDIYPTGSSTSGTATCDAFDVSWLKNSSSNNVLYTYAELRIYSGHSFTITPKDGYTITSIVITANNSSYASAVGGSSLTNCSKSVSGSTVTLTPNNGTSAVGFANSAQSRLNYIVVNYEYESSGSSEPTLSSISLNTDNVTKAFTVNATFTYSGLVVTAHYSDLTSATINSGYTVSNPDMSTTGNKTITVTYLTKSATYQITVSSAAATSITATVSKTYTVGESISASDITVKDNYNNTIESFSFANDGYSFTYADAASGGSLTDKTFTDAISYSNLTCSLTVQVQRVAYDDVSEATDSVTYTDLPTSYQTSTTERTAASGIKFIAYNLANYSSKMQFKASGGYFQTTQSMNLKSLTINNRETNALTVYGSTNGTSFSQTITGTNDVYDLTGYNYVKVMKSGSGAAYCASLSITYGGSETPVNVANYIMYEDTINQCTSKLSTALGYLSDLSSTDLATFQESTDYVISTARTRLEAWARNQGKSITYTVGEVTANSNPVLTILNNQQTNLTTIIIAILVGAISLGSISVYIYLRRRRSEI